MKAEKEANGAVGIDGAAMIFEILKKRFHENRTLHAGLDWADVERRLREDPESLEILRKMEESGGEPDTIGADEETDRLIFCDCAKESPFRTEKPVL